MNKTELVAAVAAKTEMSKKDAEKVLAAMLDTMAETLAAGEKVQLVGFGTFEAKERGERTAKNPRTGETVTVPATRVPAFKAGQALKTKIAK
jgi:DNA-binding protein HU-beta